MVKIADGALVAVRGADPQQVQPIADRFMQLVANTRGLQLHTAAAADPHLPAGDSLANRSVAN
jgi:hexosaminidase